VAREKGDIIPAHFIRKKGKKDNHEKKRMLGKGNTGKRRRKGVGYLAQHSQEGQSGVKKSK